MGKGFTLLRRTVQGSTIAIVFICTLLLVWGLGPWIETKFFAPVGKLQILTMLDNGDGTTTITAAFHKTRDCEYVGIAWYRGTQDGQFERVPIALPRQPGDLSSPNRPVGYQRAGPWLISVPIGEIKTNSFAELFRRCHPFWVTKTAFYP